MTLQINPAEDLASIPYENVRTKFLRLAAGSADLNVDGSSPSVTASWTVPSGFVFLFHRINFLVYGNVAVSANGFGSGSALTNGLDFFVNTPQGTEHDLLDGVPIKTNGDFAAFAGVDVNQLAGSKGVGVRWTLSKATSDTPLAIEPGASIVLRINDDLSALGMFRANAQGVIARP